MKKKGEEEEKERNERKINSEIEEIESEISLGKEMMGFFFSFLIKKHFI